MDTHVHYVVLAYERYDAATDRYMNTIECDVLASTEKQALDRAKQLVKKECYRVSRVVEHLDSTPCR